MSKTWIVCGLFAMCVACAPGPPVAAAIEVPQSTRATKPPSERVDICVAVIDHARRCNDSDEESDCPRQRECATALLRPEALSLLPECLRSHPCDESPRVCLADAGAQLTSLPEYATYARACRARRDACGEEAFDEDYCGPEMAPFRREVLELLGKCVLQPCSEMSSCIKEAIRSAGCK